MSALLSEALPGTGWWLGMLAEGWYHCCEDLTAANGVAIATKEHLYNLVGWWLDNDVRSSAFLMSSAIPGGRRARKWWQKGNFGQSLGKLGCAF